MTLAIQPADPDYAGETLRWIGRMYDFEPGDALLNRVRDRAEWVAIHKPPAMILPNAWVEPDHSTESRACKVYFDPRHWPNPADSQERQPDIILFTLLQSAYAWLAEGMALDAPTSPALQNELQRYCSALQITRDTYRE